MGDAVTCPKRARAKSDEKYLELFGPKGKAKKNPADVVVKGTTSDDEVYRLLFNTKTDKSSPVPTFQEKLKKYSLGMVNGQIESTCNAKPRDNLTVPDESDSDFDIVQGPAQPLLRKLSSLVPPPSEQTPPPVKRKKTAEESYHVETRGAVKLAEPFKPCGQPEYYS